MLHFKACPKCLTGTIEHNFDQYGEYAECLNCGYMNDIPVENKLPSIEKLLAQWRAERMNSAEGNTEIVA